MLPDLSVLLLNEHFVVVNKPPNMLSVPGKLSIFAEKEPRHIEWRTAVYSAANNYIGNNMECREILSNLKKYNSFPRKEKPFKLFVQKSLRMDRNDILNHVWEAVVEEDIKLHMKPLDQIPTDVISAAEIMGARYGKIYHVHRLDMSTSGILLFARGEDSCNLLSKQFRDRGVCKIYIAEVLGKLEEQEFDIEVPIRGDMENRPRQIVDFELGKPSHTRGKVLAYRTRRFGEGDSSELFDTTVVELKPLTGRTHQLRLHMAHKGYPILGDDLYSSRIAQEIAENRLHLHAYNLNFRDPYEKTKEYQVTTSCPFYGDYMSAVLIAEVSPDEDTTVVAEEGATMPVSDIALPNKRKLSEIE